MGGSTIKFSLVVATVGRTHELTRLLGSLKAQTYQKFEVILVDQNPPGFLTEVVAPFLTHFSIVHVRSETGLSMARNAGLGHITGQVVGFPDDDCWYPPDALECIADLLSTHPECGGVTGRPADPGSPDSFPWYDRTSGAVDLMTIWHRSISITIFLRREVIQAAGRFDENLGLGTSTGLLASEESEYLIRVLKLGFPVRYCENIRVYHPERPLHDELRIARAFGHGRSFGYVLRKHEYPLTFVMRTWIRALGGAAQSLFRGNPARSRYYWASLRGRLHGWFVDSRRTEGRYAAIAGKTSDRGIQRRELQPGRVEGSKSSQSKGCAASEDGRA